MNKILISVLFVLIFLIVSCGGDDAENFPNEHDGLSWSDASSNYMDWDEAITYCENLGGRLPTISELRTLIQNCPETETGGECGVTDSCLSFDDCRNSPCKGCEYDYSGKYSVFGMPESLWSSSVWSDDPDIAWLVTFENGYVTYDAKYNKPNVRCVR